jgi:hypothetical protein
MMYMCCFSVLHESSKAIKQKSFVFSSVSLCPEYFLHQPPKTIKQKSCRYFLLCLCVLNIFFYYVAFWLLEIYLFVQVLSYLCPILLTYLLCYKVVNFDTKLLSIVYNTCVP